MAQLLGVVAGSDVKVRTRMPLHKVIRRHIDLPDGSCGEMTFIWATRKQLAKDVQVLGGGWWVIPIGPFVAAWRIVA